MKRFEICHECPDSAHCVARLLSALDGLGLDLTLETTLATLPGSVHWHLRKRGERAGVLEYTMDSRRGTSWLSYQENRFQPWIDEAVGGLLAVGCEGEEKQPG
ncbi:hypothetical protein BH11ARM2_BH11ARM2_19560 [soil metagenome]